MEVSPLRIQKETMAIPSTKWSCSMTCVVNTLLFLAPEVREGR